MAKHIDLPGHDKVISKVKFYINLSSALMALTAATFWAAIAWWLTRFETPFYVTLAGAMLILLFIWCRYGDDLTTWYNRRLKKTLPSIAGVLCVVGFVLAGYAGYISFGESDRLNVVLWAFGGAIAGGLIGSVGVMILCALTALALWIALIPGMVVQPLLSLISYAFRRHFKKHHSEWLVDGNKLLVNFVGGNISVSGTTKNVYVVDPALRRNGLAEERKIPRFTYSQLMNERKASVDLTKAAIAGAAASGLYIATSGSSAANQVNETSHDLASAFDSALNGSNLEMPVFNPTTGLPMVGNIHGGIDVGGNLYGHVDAIDMAGSAGGGYSVGGMDSSGGMNHDQW
ncbi:MAG: hypothetical protein ITG07_15085 [Candidimonas sp.]|nr:hypothetical protein [Candidimonas sp.]